MPINRPLEIADALQFKGAIDASANPNYPAANAGHLYRISVAGKIGGAAGLNVEPGDTILCHLDNSAAGDQATVGANWSISQSNIDGAVVGPASAVSGNLTAFSGPTGKLVADSGLAPVRLAFAVPASGVAGTADAIALTLTSGPALADALTLSFQPAAASTGDVTIAYNGGGAVQLLDSAGVALAANALTATAPVLVRYDATATKWRLVSGGAAGASAPLDVAGETTSPKRSLSARFGDMWDAADYGVDCSGNAVAGNKAAWEALADLANAAGKIVTTRKKVIRFAAGQGTTKQPRKMRDIIFGGEAVNANTTIGTNGGWTAETILGDVGTDIFATGYETNALTAAITAPTTTITVTAGAHVYAAGQVHLLYEAVAWHGALAGDSSNRSEYVLIRSASLSAGVWTLTLDAQVQGIYSTSATLRYLPPVDIDWEGIKILGGGPTRAHEGVLLMYHRHVRIIGLEGFDCDHKVLTPSGYSSVIDDIWGYRATDDGFGYILDSSGMNNAQIGKVNGRDSKHVMTGGGGFNKILARNGQVDSVHGTGADGIMDLHPGAVDWHIKSVTGRMNAYGATSGDAIVCQGSGFRVGHVNVSGFRNNLFLAQYYGDGDGKSRPIYIDDLNGTTNIAGAQYGIFYEERAGGTTTAGPSRVGVGHINSLSPRGVEFAVSVNTIESVGVGSGKISISGTAVTDGMRVFVSGTGKVNQAAAGCEGPLQIKMSATTGLYPLYFAGSSGTQNIVQADVGQVYLDGGQYPLRVDHCLCLVTSMTAINQLTSNTTLIEGTGGDIRTTTRTNV